MIYKVILLKQAPEDIQRLLKAGEKKVVDIVVVEVFSLHGHYCDKLRITN